MGNRVKGRTKRKSVKAAAHSGMGSKRKLSRMGKKRQKNKSGLDATFIGRSACLRRLQLSLKDFRRLCILKGIYPREPRGRTPQNKKGQVYYHIKDVRAIAHEPILEKFRSFRAFMKKVRRAAGRMDKEEARRLDASAPRYGLTHIVRERYPRFVDALSDLDDALALVYLFAALPSDGRIKTRVTTRAKELSAAWSAYCAATSSVTKTFISVKGVYFEADVCNTTAVRWIVPHAFTQNLPRDVDYRVMLTFFEFYETLLGFVLYKLYNDIGVRYPITNIAADGAASNGGYRSLLAAHLAVLGGGSRDGRPSSGGGVSRAVTEAVVAAASSSAEKEESSSSSGRASSKKRKKNKKDGEVITSIGAALVKITDEGSDGEEGDGDNDDTDDDDEGEDGATAADGDGVAGPLKAALDSLAREEEEGASSMGGSATASGGGAPRHQLGEDAVRRRRLFSGLTFFLSREVPRGYIDLVCLSYGGRVGWDGDDSPIGAKDRSITHHIVDRPVLPSSFDSLPKSREYVQPQWVVDCANFHFLLPCSRYGVGVALPPHLSPFVDDEEEGYRPAYAEEIERLRNGEAPDMGEVETGLSKTVESEEDDNTDERATDKEEEGAKDETVSSSDEGEDSEESEDESAVEDKSANKSKEKEEDEEAKELAKLMMSKKAKRLYGRMQHGIAQKQAKVDELNRKRKEIEQTKEKSKDGKTPQKQKVDRLKKERRDLELEYEKAGGSAKKKKKKGTYQ